MVGVTPRQLQLLNFIQAYIDKNGYAPSYVEMSEGLDPPIKSKGNISILMRRLQERGRIEFIPGRERSVTVL
jgi:SOS-response transcriptional repressor LexA